MTQRLWYAGAWRTPAGVERHRAAGRARKRRQYATAGGLYRHLMAMRRHRERQETHG